MLLTNRAIRAEGLAPDRRTRSGAGFPKGRPGNANARNTRNARWHSKDRARLRQSHALRGRYAVFLHRNLRRADPEICRGRRAARLRQRRGGSRLGQVHRGQGSTLRPDQAGIMSRHTRRFRQPHAPTQRQLALMQRMLPGFPDQTRFPEKPASRAPGPVSPTPPSPVAPIAPPRGYATLPDEWGAGLSVGASCKEKRR